ncbi:hypothetical protein PGT21_012174 [Puccinia graminis f. sp. tritici]|uniref:Uncharacterized protein n=1 Tax=Puccinia graminis f. sp. tritici TaxID=56615 RepID=A0A5B0MNT0_PUCGR|nr:hypothetical protein PGT21_012174 [Puccinia graminis f. sp. tritici]
MVDSANSLIISTPPAETQQQHHERQAAELVMRGFSKLFIKCAQITITDQPQETTRRETRSMSSKLINTKRELLERLQTTLLPRLQAQMENLSELFLIRQLSDLQPDLLIQRQSELDQSLDEIQAARTTLAQEPSASLMNSDSELQGIKRYRLSILTRLLAVELFSVLRDQSQVSCKTIQLFLTNAARGNPGPLGGAFLHQVVSAIRLRVFKSISHALDRSDFCILQWRWPAGFPVIEQHLHQHLRLIKRQEDWLVHDPVSSDEPATDSLVPLQRAIVALLKLARLFYKKLSSERGIGRLERFMPRFSGLSSAQLATLGESPNRFFAQLTALYELTHDDSSSDAEGIEEEEDPDSIYHLSQLIRQIQSNFSDALSIVEYFVTLLPVSTAGSASSSDTDSHQTQCYFRTWFENWNSSFTLAIHNLNVIVNAFIASAESGST